jgi:nucleoside-diphosphate-sugar epimerase
VKHLVTGGSGFLGAHLVRRLRALSHEVVVLDAHDDPTRPREVKLVLADIRDRRALRAALKGVDVVHHNVDVPPLARPSKDRSKVLAQGSQVAAEEAALARVRLFVHTSCSAVFGVPRECPITPTTQPNPNERYGVAKLEAERAVEEVSRREALPLLVLRPHPIVGEGRLGLFQLLFQWVYQGRDLYTLGAGQQRLQMIHVDDLIDASLLACERGRTGTLNVGTPHVSSLREALEALIHHAKSSSRVRSVPERPAICALRILSHARLSPIGPTHYLLHHKESVSDVTALLSMGWMPRYSNATMLQQAYDWYVRQVSPGPLLYSPHRRPVNEGLIRVARWLS